MSNWWLPFIYHLVHCDSGCHVKNASVLAGTAVETDLVSDEFSRDSTKGNHSLVTVFVYFRVAILVKAFGLLPLSVIGLTLK